MESTKVEKIIGVIGAIIVYMGVLSFSVTIINKLEANTFFEISMLLSSGIGSIILAKAYYKYFMNSIKRKRK